MESSSMPAPSLGEIGVGKLGFIERPGLWTDAQAEAAERLIREIDESDLRQFRISWGDQHGILRGKTVSRPDFLAALRNGHDFQSATLVMDTTNNIFVPLFVEGGGFG